MPALSPTMEAGSIAKWCLKEGDRFGPGVAVCEVETDKATVTYEATEDGYLAKILVGSGEVKVGQPLMITVEDASTISSFANYSLVASAAPKAAPTPAAPAAPVSQAASTANSYSAPVSAPTSNPSGRVFASPFARKLARDAGIDISQLKGSGPNGRIIADDVLHAPKIPVASAQPAIASTTAPPVPSQPSSTKSTSASVAVASAGIPGVYSDFELSDVARAVANRFASAKQHVPHYYVSIDINLSKLLKLRAQLNNEILAGDKKASPLSVQDFLVKAAGLAMKQVPDINGSWQETFVRRYEQVDINLVMGNGAGLVTPVIRDVNSLGLKSISNAIADFEDSLFSEDGSKTLDASKLQPGTFSIHNLGSFGVKAAAPIVLPPQACALSIGSIIDTVIPNDGKEGENNWKVAPVFTATLSIDHRVVDGAVAAQWLAAYRQLLENPMSMIL